MIAQNTAPLRYGAITLFTTTNHPVNALIEDIDLGKIGLPEH